MKATVAERGQVTIPKPLCDKLGLSAGAILDFDEGTNTASTATARARARSAS